MHGVVKKIFGSKALVQTSGGMKVFPIIKLEKDNDLMVIADRWKTRKFKVNLPSPNEVQSKAKKYGVDPTEAENAIWHIRKVIKEFIEMEFPYIRYIEDEDDQNFYGIIEMRKKNQKEVPQTIIDPQTFKDGLKGYLEGIYSEDVMKVWDDFIDNGKVSLERLY